MRLFRFGQDAAATAWMRQAPEYFASFSSYSDVASIDRAETFGDESQTFSYAFVVDGEKFARGHIVVARVGRLIAAVIIEATPEAPLSVAEDLMDAQIACLSAGSCFDPIPLPAALAASVR